MPVDPPKDEGLDRLLQEIHRNLQENQRFLTTLALDQRTGEQAGPEFDADLDEEQFEEL